MATPMRYSHTYAVQLLYTNETPCLPQGTATPTQYSYTNEIPFLPQGTATPTGYVYTYGTKYIFTDEVRCT